MKIQSVELEHKPKFPGGFTVLMAVYQRDSVALFESAVRSVYANSISPDASVLVVDGPIPPPLQEGIDSLRKRFGLLVVYLPENVGLAAALNTGLRHVHTQWVVRADADDYNVPNRFAMLAEAISADSSIDIIGGAIEEVDPDGNRLSVRRTVQEHEDIVQYAVHRNPFNHMTVAFRTELAVRCGGYPGIKLMEDYALWATLISLGARVANLRDVIVVATTGKDMYRRRGGMRYALSEIQLQRHLVRVGLKSIRMAVFHGMIRGSVFLMPSMVRGWIYERFLRKRV